MEDFNDRPYRITDAQALTESALRRGLFLEREAVRVDS